MRSRSKGSQPRVQSANPSKATGKANSGINLIVKKMKPGSSGGRGMFNNEY